MAWGDRFLDRGLARGRASSTGATAICRYGDPSNISLARDAGTTWRALDYIGEHRARCDWRILVLPPRSLGISKDRQLCSGRLTSS